MANTEDVLLGLLVIDALALVVLVLIQQGKGADIGAAFGSGASSTMFGSSGTGSFLVKLTTWLAIGFFAISFGLAWTAKERASSLSDLGIPQLGEPVSGSPLGMTPGEATSTDMTDAAGPTLAPPAGEAGSETDAQIPDLGDLEPLGEVLDGPFDGTLEGMMEQLEAIESQDSDPAVPDV